jgi:hypothetical protein
VLKSKQPDSTLLYRFYEAVKNNRLSSIHLFHSDVYYIREALFNRTGVIYELKEIESAIADAATATTKSD